MLSSAGKLERGMSLRALIVVSSFLVFAGVLPAAAESTSMLSPTDSPLVAGDTATPGYEAGWEDAGFISGAAPTQYAGSMYWITNSVTGASEYWNAGWTGAGVGVALIDTGVVPVNGLTTPGKIINGADLSFESQSDRFRHLDAYGHGTHLAGIIAGRDDGAVIAPGNSTDFLGMAPGARIINVKVGDREGSVDVSQVIAAIDWVIQRRNDPGLNIRVLNLSFGTNSIQPYQIDPLAYVVERAWKAGITVVVAAGNDGNAAPLRNPAISPYIIAVGASVENNTPTPSDDIVAGFSNCGTDRTVDLVAPGKSIVSLRNPGSTADAAHAEAVVNDRFFLGSGTSQAAAIVSGAAALIIQQRPTITPGQLKMLLKSTAQPMPLASPACQGSGHLDLGAARLAPTAPLKDATQKHKESVGNGSIEAARGSDHLTNNGVVLRGEKDIMGRPWTGWCANNPSDRRAAQDCVTTFWSGGNWNGAPWSGTSWSGTSWSGTSWSGTSWSGTSWSGTSWSGTSWSDMAWSGTSWSGTSWSGTSWSGTSWSGTSWSGLRARGQSWG